MEIILGLSHEDVQNLRLGFLRSKRGGLTEPEFIEMVIRLESAQIGLEAGAKAALRDGPKPGGGFSPLVLEFESIALRCKELVHLFDIADASGDGIVTWDEMFNTIVLRGSALGQDGFASSSTQ